MRTLYFNSNSQKNVFAICNMVECRFSYSIHKCEEYISISCRDLMMEELVSLVGIDYDIYAIRPSYLNELLFHLNGTFSGLSIALLV